MHCLLGRMNGEKRTDWVKSTRILTAFTKKASERGVQLRQQSLKRQFTLNGTIASQDDAVSERSLAKEKLKRLYQEVQSTIPELEAKVTNLQTFINTEHNPVSHWQLETLREHQERHCHLTFEDFLDFLTSIRF